MPIFVKNTGKWQIVANLRLAALPAPLLDLHDPQFQSQICCFHFSFCSLYQGKLDLGSLVRLKDALIGKLLLFENIQQPHYQINAREKTCRKFR
jgi:hypothetical protein